MQKPKTSGHGGLKPMNTLGGPTSARQTGRFLGNGKTQVQVSNGHDDFEMGGRREFNTAMGQPVRKKRKVERDVLAQMTYPDDIVEEIDDSMNEEDVLNRDAPDNPVGRRITAPHFSATRYRISSSDGKHPSFGRRHNHNKDLEEYGTNPEYHKRENMMESRSYARKQEKRAKAEQKKPRRNPELRQSSADLIETGVLLPGIPSISIDRSAKSEPHSHNLTSLAEMERTNARGGSVREEYTHVVVRLPLAPLEATTAEGTSELQRNFRYAGGISKDSKLQNHESDGLGVDSNSISSTEDVLATDPTKPRLREPDRNDFDEMLDVASQMLLRPKWKKDIPLQYLNAGHEPLNDAGMFIQIDLSDASLKLRTYTLDWHPIARLGKIQKITVSQDKGCLKLRLKSSKDCSEPGSETNLVDIECIDPNQFRALVLHLKKESGVEFQGVDAARMERLFSFRVKTAVKASKDRPQCESQNHAIDTQLIQLNQQRRKEHITREEGFSKKIPGTGKSLGKSLRGNPDSEAPNKESIDVQSSDHLVILRAQGPREYRETSDFPYNTRAQAAESKPKFRYPTAAHGRENDLDEKVGFSVYPGLGPRWKRPLTFPKSGKGAVTVDFDDLIRLDEGEFLNDNLIEFYLKRSAYQLERRDSVIAGKVYWFNTYFFESLNKISDRRRGINFDSVKKWTRSVDIFAYDYVVIPINEAAHWYVAVICNLPSLNKPPEPSRVEDVPEGTFSQPIGLDATQDENDGHTADRDKIFLGPADSESRDNAEESAWSKEPPSQLTLHEDHARVMTDDRDEHERFDKEMLDNPGGIVTDNERATGSADASLHGLISPPLIVGAQAEASLDISGKDHEIKVTQPENNVTTTSNGRKVNQRSSHKKRRSSIRTYDPKEPAIITLDSLGFTHPATTRALKTYLLQEAQDKKGEVHFEDKQIKGLTARGIPLQDNFCDCGLYLLGYIDKFIEDPDQFVARLLKREFNEEKDWPELKPSLMRQQMRELIFGLHKEQELEKKAKKRNSTNTNDQQSSPLPITKMQKSNRTQKQIERRVSPQEEKHQTKGLGESPQLQEQNSSVIIPVDGEPRNNSPDFSEKMILEGTETNHEPSKPANTKYPPTIQSMPGKKAPLADSDSQEHVQWGIPFFKPDDDVFLKVNRKGTKEVQHTADKASLRQDADSVRRLDNHEALATHSARGDNHSKALHEIISIDDN